MTKELYSVKEAAVYLGVSAGQVYQLCYDGVIDSFVLDGTRTRRIRKGELEAYIERSGGKRNDYTESVAES